MPDTKTLVSPLPAIAVCAAGIFFLSAMDAAVKGLVVVMGAYNTLLWRAVFATASAGTAWTAWPAACPDAKALRLHTLRGVVVCFVALSFFWGLGRLPLAEAVALSFIAPLLALVLAVILLGETMARGVIAASFVGLAGVVVIMLGKLSRIGYAPEAFLGTLAILASAVLYAYNLILARRQAQLATPLEIAFFQNLTVAIVLGFAAPWLGALPPAGYWLPLIGVTALGLCGQVLMNWSYARAEAQYLIPTEYSAFVWAILLGWIFFQEQPQLSTLAGAAMIILACLLASRSKPKLAEPIEAAAV